MRVCMARIVYFDLNINKSMCVYYKRLDYLLQHRQNIKNSILLRPVSNECVSYSHILVYIFKFEYATPTIHYRSGA